jgi:hypothetical protein
VVAACNARDTFGSPLDDLTQYEDGLSARTSSSDPDWRNGNNDARPIAPDEIIALADVKGPGVITHIWNTYAAIERGNPRLIVLRIYWDGETNPSVECPIGDFFGVGHGMEAAFQSLPVTVNADGHARNCYWRMPFRKSAKITVANEGRSPVPAFYWQVDWIKIPRLGHRTVYFHAQYRQEHPAIMGRNYLIADIVGRGHYVGTVLSVHGRIGHWWGEGDDFFFIDGDEEPTLRGTGSEDYFGDGWGLHKACYPFSGVTWMERGMTTAYRWHVADPVVFKKSLHVEIEHKGVIPNPDGSIKAGFEERPDDFSSVAFWYQTEPHKPFPPLPPAQDRLYVDYSKIIEAEDLVPKAKASSGTVTVEQGGGLSGGAQLVWKPVEANQTLDVPLDVKEGGKHSITFVFSYGPDRGIVQLDLDGKPLGATWDFYSPTTPVKERACDTGELEPGSHTLTFRNIGKHYDSSGYAMGLDGLLLFKEES